MHEWDVRHKFGSIYKILKFITVSTTFSLKIKNKMAEASTYGSKTPLKIRKFDNEIKFYEIFKY